MAWNDNFAGAVMQTASFVNMFLEAHRERAQVLGGFIGTPANLINGNILQFASLVATLQNLPVATYSQWVDPTTNILSRVPTSVYPFPDDSDAQAIVYQSLGEVFTAAGLNPDHGFERKRPREIENITDVVDTQGNVAAANQLAYLLPERGLYRCALPGDWVRALTPGLRPDLLSNYLDAPNHVVDEVELDEDGNPFTTGVMQVGDYFGSWIWRQLRDVFNQLRWTTTGGLSIIGDNEGHHKEGEGNDVNFATAMAAGQAAYGAHPGGPFTTWPLAYSIASYPSGSYDVFYSRSTGNFDTAYPTPAGLTRQIVFYVAGMNIGNVTNPVYDDNGDGITEGHFGVIDTVTTTDANIRSRLVGNVGLPTPADPAIPPVDEDPLASTSRGWQVMSTLSIARWDVTGGLVYHP